MTREEHYPYGTLILKVRTALGAFPVPDATVTVTSEKRTASNVVFEGRTDAAGISEAILLPSGLTLDPGPGETGSLTPDTYTVEVIKDGYYTLLQYGVPVYPDVTAVQTLYLTPRPRRSGGEAGSRDTQYSEGIREEAQNGT